MMQKVNGSKATVVTVMLAGVLCNSLAIASSSGCDGAAARDSYLLLDSRIIETTENAALKIGTVKKDPRNPLFGEDKPWEPRFDNVYASVVYDKKDGLYKCW